MRRSHLHHLHVAAIENQPQQGFLGVLERERVAPRGLRHSVALFSVSPRSRMSIPSYRPSTSTSALAIRVSSSVGMVEHRFRRSKPGQAPRDDAAALARRRGRTRPLQSGIPRTSAWTQRIVRISPASVGSDSASASGQRTERASTRCHRPTQPGCRERKIALSGAEIEHPAGL